jgi:hypothetical protein
MTSYSSSVTKIKMIGHERIAAGVAAAVGRGRGLPTMPRERKLKVLALIEQGADEIAAAADPPSKITPGRPRVPPRRPNY